MRRLVIGTGTGALPVMKEVKREAMRRKIKLVILPTAQAIKKLREQPEGTDAVLLITSRVLALAPLSKAHPKVTRLAASFDRVTWSSAQSPRLFFTLRFCSECL
jgi:hypothetical protein